MWPMWLTSLPSRERGLKCFYHNSKSLACKSLPSRERGLKLPCLAYQIRLHTVAPFAGAWIEMAWLLMRYRAYSVAPFAGAWIEISLFVHILACLVRVAPFAGAWIEIRGGRPAAQHRGSLPSRERGLKSSYAGISTAATSSLPSRERGLKSRCRTGQPKYAGRSLRGSVD